MIRWELSRSRSPSWWVVLSMVGGSGIGGVWIASFFRIEFLVANAATQSAPEIWFAGTLRGFGLVPVGSLLELMFSGGNGSRFENLLGLIFSALSWLKAFLFWVGVDCLVSWVFMALVIIDERSDIEGVWLRGLNELSF